MKYEQMNRLLEFHEEIELPADFTNNIMKEVRKIKTSKINAEPLYQDWGISLIAAAVCLLVINVSGLQAETDYNKFLSKTTIIQRSITLSVDETSKTILQKFNNITGK